MGKNSEAKPRAQSVPVLSQSSPVLNTKDKQASKTKDPTLKVFTTQRKTQRMMPKRSAESGGVGTRSTGENSNVLCDCTGARRQQQEGHNPTLERQ